MLTKVTLVDLGAVLTLSISNDSHHAIVIARWQANQNLQYGGFSNVQVREAITLAWMIANNNSIRVSHYIDDRVLQAKVARELREIGH